MANLFVNFPNNIEPPMPPTETNQPLSVKFDFSHYNITGDSKAITLPSAQCLKGSFVVAVEADGLISGRLYTITFELLNPSSTRQVFDPSVLQIFASTTKQKLTTVANVDPQYSYILKVTIKQTDTAIAASDIIAVSCDTIPMIPTPTPTPTVPPKLKISFDNGPVMSVKEPNRCTEQLNIIATISNSQLGKTYRYDFAALTPNADITLSPASGVVTAGSHQQNINTVLTINDIDSSLLSLQIKLYDIKYPNNILDEDILLIKCYECK